jgi:peptidyl-tRNA hydrolase, PTH2 family
MKQVIVIRTDLGMSPGKVAAQACHASIEAYKKAQHTDIDQWERNGTTKIILSCNSENDLLRLYQASVGAELAGSLICDEGRTEVKPGTLTCLGIGPAPSNRIDAITRNLQLFTGSIHANPRLYLTKQWNVVTRKRDGKTPKVIGVGPEFYTKWAASLSGLVRFMTNPSDDERLIFKSARVELIPELEGNNLVFYYD